MTAIQSTLPAGSRVRHPTTGRPLFVFRLHQFVSKGDDIQASVSPSVPLAQVFHLAEQMSSVSG